MAYAQPLTPEEAATKDMEGLLLSVLANRMTPAREAMEAEGFRYAAIQVVHDPDDANGWLLRGVVTQGESARAWAVSVTRPEIEDIAKLDAVLREGATQLRKTFK